MADLYLAVAIIANDEYMVERMRACATQQTHLGNAPVISNDPVNTSDAWSAIDWVDKNRYIWASSPSWGEKWEYSMETHSSDPNYEPGKDEAVITDADILATVQKLTGPQEV